MIVMNVKSQRAGKSKIYRQERKRCEKDQQVFIFLSDRKRCDLSRGHYLLREKSFLLKHFLFRSNKIGINFFLNPFRFLIGI